MMDYQTQLKCSYITYIVTKIIQLVYQIFHIAWLAVTYDDGVALIYLTGTLILILILISYFLLYKCRERLMDENGIREEYSSLFKVDHCIFFIALIGYAFGGGYLVESKYSNRSVPYPQHINDSLLLKVNETNVNNWELLNKTIEQVETTTNMLIDEALDMRNGLIYLINTEETSVLEDIHQNESYVIMPQALSKPLKKQKTYFTVLTLLCIVFHFTVVISLHWIERSKRKIKEAAQEQQPPELEMAEINEAQPPLQPLLQEPLEEPLIGEAEINEIALAA